MDGHRNENWLGLWTLYWREVRRFVKVYNQTILAPVVMNGSIGELSIGPVRRVGPG